MKAEWSYEWYVYPMNDMYKVIWYVWKQFKTNKLKQVIKFEKYKSKEI